MVICLLIVVLIAGVLMIVAFPQYKKAKEQRVKAEALHMAEAVQYLEDFAAAQKAYYAQHKDFAEDIEDLNFTLPAPGPANAFEYITDMVPEQALCARRQSGVYEGGMLTIAVEIDGTIIKDCEGPDGFCRLAESAGYKRGAIDSMIDGTEK